MKKLTKNTKKNKKVVKLFKTFCEIEIFMPFLSINGTINATKGEKTITMFKTVII